MISYCDLMEKLLRQAYQNQEWELVLKRETVSHFHLSVMQYWINSQFYGERKIPSLVAGKSGGKQR